MFQRYTACNSSFRATPGLNRGQPGIQDFQASTFRLEFIPVKIGTGMTDKCKDVGDTTLYHSSCEPHM